MKNETIARIQWSNSTCPKITIYGNSGVIAILDGPAAGLFTEIIRQALGMAQATPEPVAEGAPV